MPHTGPEHPLTYRQEIAAPLFQLIQSGESAALVGSASMGKTRLLQFLRRSDVQRHYLGEDAAATWLVLVDCQRLAEASEWGLYELLLTTLTEAALGEPALRDWLNGLRNEVVTRRDGLLALRSVELATRWRIGSLPPPGAAATGLAAPGPASSSAVVAIEVMSTGRPPAAVPATVMG